MQVNDGCAETGSEPDEGAENREAENKDETSREPLGTTMCVETEPTIGAARAIHKLRAGIQIEIEGSFTKAPFSGAAGPARNWNLASEKVTLSLLKKEASGAWSDVTDGSDSVIGAADGGKTMVATLRTWVRPDTTYTVQMLVRKAVGGAHEDWMERFDAEFSIPLPNPMSAIPANGQRVKMTVVHGALAPMDEPTPLSPIEWRIGSATAINDIDVLSKQIQQLKFGGQAIVHNQHLHVPLRLWDVELGGSVCLAIVRSLRRVEARDRVRIDGTPHRVLYGYADKKGYHPKGHAVDVDPFDAGSWYFNQEPAYKRRARAIEVVTASPLKVVPETLSSASRRMSYDELVQLQVDYRRKYAELGTQGVRRRLAEFDLGGDIPGSAESLNTTGFIAVSRGMLEAFQQEGWTWGGTWADPKDLHHFQYPDPDITDAQMMSRASAVRKAVVQASRAPQRTGGGGAL